jgi:FkbM family methyltransferase
MSARVAVRDLLLQMYGSFSQRGWLTSAVGRSSYELAYDVYKRTLEVPGIRHLQRFVPPGATVIDVGANIGFFTMRFAQWVGESGRVLAIEPARDNAACLARRLKGRGLMRRVHLIEAVAAETEGSAHLALNPRHPGDHRISDRGIEVQAVTIDAVLTASAGPVTLIKVDVQGAELRVLTGARDTVARFRPALLVEVDAAALCRFGTPVATLVDFLAAQRYAPYSVMRRGIAPIAMSKDELVARSSREDSDVLFLPLPPQP